MRNARTYVPLPEELKARVEARRKARCSTTANVIREALFAGLALLETRDKLLGGADTQVAGSPADQGDGWYEAASGLGSARGRS